MNAVIMARKRSSAQSFPEPTPGPSLIREGRFAPPSPEKGVERGIRGTLRRARGMGRLYKGGPAGQEGFAAVESGFCIIYRRQTPLIPPLSGGSGQVIAFIHNLRQFHAIALVTQGARSTFSVKRPVRPVLQMMQWADGCARNLTRPWGRSRSPTKR
jgi:hypothetical protein